jgi:hypothetical protein
LEKTTRVPEPEEVGSLVDFCLLVAELVDFVDVVSEVEEEPVDCLAVKCLAVELLVLAPGSCGAPTDATWLARSRVAAVPAPPSGMTPAAPSSATEVITVETDAAAIRRTLGRIRRVVSLRCTDTGQPRFTRFAATWR